MCGVRATHKTYFTRKAYLQLPPTNVRSPSALRTPQDAQFITRASALWAGDWIKIKLALKVLI